MCDIHSAIIFATVIMYLRQMKVKASDMFKLGKEMFGKHVQVHRDWNTAFHSYL
jgi:hypothetical protein